MTDVKAARYVVVLVGLLCAAVAAIVLAGRRRFRRRVDADVATLFADGGAVGPSQLNARRNALPEPVRRYLRYAIPEGTVELRSARLTHDGFFRQSREQQWLAITGEQYFTVAEPGFVWNATIRPAPFLWIEARDCLVGGRGHMLVKLASTFPIADATGAEIDQGARLRWLAECAWFPYAFVGDVVQWEPVDDRWARARLAGGGVPVSALLEVDAEGRLVQLRADRYRDLGGGRAVLTPWAGRYADYREFGGLRVPTSVDVAWEVDGQSFSYARFRVRLIEYNTPRRFS